MRLSLRIVVAAIALASATSTTAAWADTLEKVVILSRHGVRSAMSSPERLEEASARPWPRFEVPAGHLTARGETLVARMGDYYRQYYVAQGLLKPGECSAVYAWANVTQRTIATGKAYAAALAPGCPVAVNTVGEGNHDPMFEPVKAGIVKADHALARAAVAGRVGDDLTAWSASHRQEAEQLDALLMQCDRGPCPPSPGKRRVFDAKPGFVDGEELAGVSGPEAFASGVTESLLMAWADGRDFAGLGWKGLDEETLTRSFFLHQAEFDLRLRTPYVARTLAGHLADRILATVQSGAKPNAAPIGPAEAKLVVISGHDGTLASLGGLLRMEWTLPGYQPNQIQPGGALVFERWKRDDGVRVIRVRFTGQSLSQLRDMTPLDAKTPPLLAPVFIQGCGTATPAFDCRLEDFEAVVRHVTRADS
ncbi:histidine-type phosphatase [Caulobacter sp. BP25]|uniref:histidine-type phosphatase n=1 Tax=Caulobacter sp. BP25 TaxID=2048900 RepID=UPI000C12C139|nr:histidine-type phosphatase [Caulobacter sp. BP25]PHY17641.1 histidine-type phosphatase [Caulobacter sp. BP25]